MTVWVPPRVKHELAQEMRGKYRAQLFALMDFDDAICKQWQPELERLDPLIRLGRAKPMAYVPGFPVMPGYYHFLRDNPDAPPTCQPITGPDGESFVEPDSALLDKLRSNDLADPRVLVEIESRREQARADEEKRKQDEREERQAEIVERWKAGNRAFVSLNRDTPWTQNARGRRHK